MKVHFIHHSGFFVETAGAYLLFDYFEGVLPEADKTKPIFLFASHSHGDHFSARIFEIGSAYANAHYILSDDIPKSRVPKAAAEKTLWVSPYQKEVWDGIEIETLQSTDMGVAFLVKADGKWLYHAGDLNCWTWNGAPHAQNLQMEQLYRAELQALADKNIFAAFVPLDPRQEDFYDRGMRHFLEIATAAHVFPMHMWGDFSGTALFQSQYPQYTEKLLPVCGDGDVFEI